MAEGLPGKLELFKADLLTEGAFDPVVQLGSQFHTLFLFSGFRKLRV